MKDNKKIDENIKNERAGDKPVDDMRELGDDDLDQIAGGVGNPFDRPRMGYQPIDDDLRGNG